MNKLAIDDFFSLSQGFSKARSAGLFFDFK